MGKGFSCEKDSHGIAYRIFSWNRTLELPKTMGISRDKFLGDFDNLELAMNLIVVSKGSGRHEILRNFSFIFYKFILYGSAMLQ